MYPPTDTTTDDPRRYYECRGCGARTVAEEHLAVCPECSERLRNIAVPRE